MQRQQHIFTGLQLVALHRKVSVGPFHAAGCATTLRLSPAIRVLPCAVRCSLRWVKELGDKNRHKRES
ncbi:hypothetical protein OJE16_19705 [Pantoea tagorei]